MSDIRILKAVEFSKLSAKFKKQYKNERALFDAGWWLQPKYDGCYAEFHVDRRSLSVHANTRTGEPIRSVNHIAKHLADLVPNGSHGVFVGELWSQDPAVKFPEISGWVRRHYAAPDLCFKVFDLLPPGLETTEAYHLRYGRLSELMSTSDDVVSRVPHRLYGRGPNEVAAELKLTGKHDGAILRDPHAGYKIGLVKNGEIVKVKPVLSLDLRVTDVFTEPGAKTGRPVYSIEVIYKGVKSKVGSGVPHKREDVPDIGQIAEVECMDITAEGKLREPRFKGTRFDKDKPD